MYRAADNREAWLKILGNICARFNWVVHAYCQMTNHYHVRVETIDGNLSRGMRPLNGRYTQRFNRAWLGMCRKGGTRQSWVC
jgi:REP element-mobilizing transposase RayT